MGDGYRLVIGPTHVRASRVVVATGCNRVPMTPPWPDDRFCGTLVHSSAYRNAVPFRDRDVLVRGTGNSGAEIATDLAVGGDQPT